MKKISLFSLLMVFAILMNAQEKLAVLNFDQFNTKLSRDQLLSITRAEIVKLGNYQVVDAYTVVEALEQSPINLDKCMGVKCLSEVGNRLKIKYVVAGTFEVLGDKANITLRLIDVTKQEAIKTSYSEFLWSDQEAPKLLQLAIHKLFEKEIDPKTLAVYDYTLAKQGNLEGPKVRKLNLTGPRFGGVYQSGKMGDIIEDKKSEGGFNKQALMTSLGFQFEKQYLYTGSMQAVFQANFSLTGLDQQMALPSLAILNGFRTTKGGWEFGFGPIFRVRKVAEGFYRPDGSWHLKHEAIFGESVEFEERLDSRGSTKLISSWVWAVGKSFRAGSMNIPVNFYVIPDKDGALFGLSMGYAISRK